MCCRPETDHKCHPVKVCGQTSVKWATMPGEIVFTSHITHMISTLLGGFILHLDSYIRGKYHRTYTLTKDTRKIRRTPCDQVLSHTKLRSTRQQDHRTLHEMETTTPISANWSYTQLTPTRVPDGAKASTVAQQEKEWHSVHKFPTGVHVELMQRNEIPDHCKGLNEWDIQVSGFLELAACEC